MMKELDFSLPERKNKKSGNKAMFFFFILLFFITGTNLFLYFYHEPQGLSQKFALTAQKQQDFALKLEKQGLAESAVKAWLEYLDIENPNKELQAKIYFRIGKIFQESREYAKALENYYRSEAIAEIKDLSPEIGKRVQECLEAMGKFAALNDELVQRVSLDSTAKNAGEKVLAEIDRQKITSLDLDKKIEQQIEMQLAQLQGIMPAEESRKQKEEMLKQFSNKQIRSQLLQSYIVEEMLYRKAREIKLPENPLVRSLLKETEKKILAREVLQRELQSKIHITQSDIQNHYKANLEKYVLEERVKISHILLKDQKEADAVLKNLSEGQKFEEAAQQFSMDESTRMKGGEIDNWIEKGSSISQIPSPQTTGIIFSTQEGNIAKEAIQSDKGFHIVRVNKRENKKQKPFEEVRQEVYSDLYRQKSQELQQSLISDLKDRYRVILYTLEEKVEEKNQEEK